MLDESVKVASQEKRHHSFPTFFTNQDGVYFCHNVTNMFEVLVITRNYCEGFLFIDGSSKSLIVVLLNKGKT